MKSFSSLQSLGIKFPIIQAPMAGVSTAEMCSKVTQFGGLGSLPFGSNIQSAIDSLNDFKLKYNTNKVNVNFFAHGVDNVVNDEMVSNWKKLYHGEKIVKNGNVSFKEFETFPQFNSFLTNLIDFKPLVVSFHFGLPSSKTIEQLKKSGILVFATVTSVEEAKYCLSQSADGLVLQGYEAGGHRGVFSEYDELLSTDALFKQVKSMNPDCFVIPAGGIVDTTTIQYYLDQGASAVQLGTAFLTTDESLANKEMISNSDLPTIMTDLISGKPARCIRTKFIQDVEKNRVGPLPPYGWMYDGYKQWKAKQDGSKGFFLVGANYKQAKHGLSTEEVMENLTKDLKL
ncbi:putative nitronate monooxygenase [[Candida] jaroonii]|uniref:Nitronate monooxygenase n=1 Tax=[Candida] jaroonii TaxID=467808 RepID=A0ACA9Y1Z6_9ASCO|nr:putative nitronate monooxygenase [[Candida] jaroonii]